MAKGKQEQKPEQKPSTYKRFKRVPVPRDEQRSYLREYQSSVEGQSDLICAILAAAYLEGALITLLDNYFVKCTTKEEIFNSTLADLFKCSQIARCLGFLNSPMLTNIQRIGDIRNVFAHNRTIRSFSHEDIKPMCFGLVLPKQIRIALEEGMELHEHLKNVTTGPSMRFKTVAGALLEDIALMADVAGKKPAIQQGVDAYW